MQTVVPRRTARPLDPDFQSKVFSAWTACRDGMLASGQITVGWPAGRFAAAKSCQVDTFSAGRTRQSRVGRRS